MPCFCRIGLVICFLWCSHFGVLALTLQSNNTIPERGGGLKLSCLTEEFYSSINWINPQNVKISTCLSSSKQCSGNSSSYSFTADNKGAYAYINSLSRMMDSGTWKCVYTTSTVDIEITVHTSPAGAHLVQPLPLDRDLGVESLTLTCQTDNCSYPAPTIAWYYRTSSGQIALYQGSTVSMFSNTDACTQSEVTYTSTLQLPRGTTFTDNIPFTTKFVCGIQHPASKGEIIYSQNSNSVTFADGVTMGLEMKTILPLKGSSLELSCRISEPFNSGEIVVLKGTSQLTKCFADVDLCRFYKEGYSFTTNSTGIFGSISSLTTEAEGMWRCSYRTSGGDIYSNTWNVIVYTIPSGLSITQDPNQNVDLSVQSIVLQCKTIGCTYPMPTVQWIFQDQATSSESVYATHNPTGVQELCVTQEQIYTSTLNLPLNTTFNDNSDKTGTFACRIEYPDSSRNIIAYASNTIRFAVRVTEAVLQQNNQNITEILTVTSAEPVTLTCVTGTSRPAPTIDWYIGSQKRGSGPSLTITFNNMDNSEMIYCQAYNTDPSRLVSSAKPRLFVRVRVTEAVLQQNNQNITEILTVTSAEPVTLTCVTGSSRPAPVIDWYVGSQKRGSGPSLTITFSNMDHNETIYCQAYNTDPSKPVLSAKPRLFVQAAPKILDISPDYKGYVGQYIMIQFDFYSNTKENLTVTAQHSNSSGLINQGIIRPTLPDDLGDSPPVPASDFRATLVVSINSKNDFGQYEIKVKNSIGSDSKSIRIIEQITPEKPLNFHATNIQEKQLSLMWQSGYHGGFTQIFVVEISLDNITWINVSQVSTRKSDGWISTTFGNLIPGSEYYLRLYAYNINGRGDFADVQLPIRMLKESGCTFSLEVGAGVGIGVGGVVLGLIGAVIALTIRRRLNGPKNSCLRSKGKTDDAMHTYSNTEMNPQTVKPIYEELNKGNTEQTVYDKISPL